MRLVQPDRWRSVFLAIAMASFSPTLVGFAQARSYVEEAEQFLKNGDLKSAVIQLRNAVREAPDDPKIRAQLAEAYLRTGDLPGAEREARAARDRKGDEADYLPVLVDVLLRQSKFADLLGQVRPGDRAPVVESKIRLAIGMAELGLHRSEKAEPALRDAVRLDPKSTQAKLAIARFLTSRDPNEADRIIEGVLAEDPRLAEAIQVKGTVLAAQGDREGAMHRFDDAIKIDPQNRSARLSRVVLNIQDRKFAAADEDLNPILKANPNDVQANLLRARELASQKQYAKADEILERLSPAFETFLEGYYLQGMTKFELGQFGQAEALLNKYIARRPEDANATRLIAMVALRQGRASRAIDYLKPLADRTPEDVATLGLLGNAYIAAGKPDLALEQFHKASAIDPDNPTMSAKVALAEMGTGKGKEGLAELERVFESEAGITVAGPALVLAELRAGQVDKAAAAVAKLVDRDPQNPLYQTLLGTVRNRQGDNAGAETALRASMKLQPGSGAAARNLANLYLAAGRTEDAAKAYQDLLAKKPNDVTGLLGLAEVAVTRQEWDQATDYLNQARTATPNDPTPGIQLVNLYLLRGDSQRAKAITDQLAAQFNTNPNVLDAQGRAQVAIGDNNGAVSTYKRAYQLTPTSGPIISRYLSLLLVTKNFPEARTLVQQAIDRNPTNAGLKVDLVRVEAQAGGLDAGIAKARSFAQADPDSARYDLVSAELYENVGRNAEAQEVLEKGVLARPSNAELKIALAGFYGRRGELAKSEALLDRVVATNPNNAAALNDLAWMHQQQGDLAKARDLAERAFAVAPRVGQIEDTLGWILLAQGEMEKALTYLKAANTAVPRDPSIQYHLAVALGRSGKSADAKSLLEKLLSSGVEFGDKAEAEKLLTKLKNG